MTTRVTVTGTGMPLVTPERAGAGCLVSYDDLHLQFDVGRWTLQRLAMAGVSQTDLAAVFLTHYHSDHVVGLQDLVLTHWTMDLDDVAPTLPIVAPNGPTIDFCHNMLTIWEDDLAVRALHNKREPRPKIDIRGFDTPDSPTEVWHSDDGEVRVIAGQVRHEPVVGAVGYRIETPDGVVAISGDTVVCDELRPLYEGADVVVQEIMRSDVINQRPPHLRYITNYHSDTRLIGALLADVGVPRVMLTHYIPAPMNADDAQLFVDEIREGGYEGEIVASNDLDYVELGRAELGRAELGSPELG